MGEWREVRLGDVADLATGYPFKSQQYTDDPGDPRLLGGDNIVQGALRWESVRRWPRTQTAGLEQYWLSAGDVVLAMDRPWIEAGLKRAALSSRDLPALLVQRTARLRGTNELETSFLRYLIGSPQFTQYVLAVQTGTAVPHISPTQIRAFGFRLPPLPEQRAIAHILGTLDEKIELNRRTSETLEAMARALFKSWFVDFDPVRAKAAGKKPAGMDDATAKLFPSELVESELGPVPKGWRVAVLGEVCSEYRQTVQPRDVPSETPYIGLEHMPPRNIALHAWGSARDAQSQKSRFSRGDILFGKLRPYFHKVGVAAIDGVCSTDIVVLRPLTPSWFGFALGHASSEAFVAYTNASADGTRMPRTSWSRMAGYPIVVPGEACAAALSRFATALVERQRSAIFEMQSLASTRDALLPKLLSGELSVSEVA